MWNDLQLSGTYLRTVFIREYSLWLPGCLDNSTPPHNKSVWFREKERERKREKERERERKREREHQMKSASEGEMWEIKNINKRRGYRCADAAAAAAQVNTIEMKRIAGDGSGCNFLSVCNRIVFVSFSLKKKWLWRWWEAQEFLGGGGTVGRWGGGEREGIGRRLRGVTFRVSNGNYQWWGEFLHLLRLRYWTCVSISINWWVETDMCDVYEADSVASLSIINDYAVVN